MINARQCGIAPFLRASTILRQRKGHFSGSGLRTRRGLGPTRIFPECDLRDPMHARVSLSPSKIADLVNILLRRRGARFVNSARKKFVGGCETWGCIVSAKAGAWFCVRVASNSQRIHLLIKMAAKINDLLLPIERREHNLISRWLKHQGSVISNWSVRKRKQRKKGQLGLPIQARSQEQTMQKEQRWIRN